MSRKSPRIVHGYDAYTTFATRFADVVAIALAGYVAYVLRFNVWHVNEERYSWAILVGVLSVLIIFPLLDIYRSWRGRVRSLLFLRLMMGYCVVGLGLTFILFFFKLSTQFSRIWIASWIALAFTGSISIRVIVYPIINRFRFKGKNRRSVLLIGDASSCATASLHLKNSPISGFDTHKVLLTDGGKGTLEKYGVEVESYQPDLLAEVTEDEVWICLPLSKGQLAKEIIARMGLLTANVRLMPDMRDFRLINHNVSQIADLYLLDVTCSPLSGTSRFRKRLEDIIISSIILIVISPILVALAIGVKLTSKGPVFYRQERVSWNGLPFMMLKFRSMPVNNETDGVKWGGAKDKTTTKFGAFIRKTSLDELPQFINVLKGDMSIVGPRPERTVFVEQFKHEIPGYMQKHMVKAGITGWAQINGWRGDTDLEKRIECDLWYIENWSVMLDFKIIVLTIFKIFIDKSAY